MSRYLLAVFVLALCCASGRCPLVSAQNSSPLERSPAYGDSPGPVTIPPWFAHRVVYYNSFNDSGKAEINAAGFSEPAQIPIAADGFAGTGYACGMRNAFILRGDALSVHRPLTLSVWWRLDQDAQIDSGLQVFHLEGRGFISAFVRGKGTWCALPKPAAVFQCYNFPRVRNVNGIYDRGIWDKGALRAGLWHHTALTVASASALRLYTDGRPVAKIDVAGRLLSTEDAVRTLYLGNRYGGIPMTLDEVAVVDRTLTPEEIARYHHALRQMAQAGYWGLQRAAVSKEAPQ